MALIPLPLNSGDCFTVSPVARSAGLVVWSSVSVAALAIAVLTELPWVALGCLIGLAGCLVVHCKAHTDVLVVGENAVVARCGVLAADVHVLALEHIQVNIRQNMLSRLLNIGTVHLHDGAQSVRIANIGEVDRLVGILLKRVGTSQMLIDARRRQP